MKKSLIFALLLSLLLFLSACDQTANIDTPSVPVSEPTEPAVDIVQIYQDAADAVLSYSRVNAKIEIDKKVYVDTQVFTENAEYSLTYTDLNQDIFNARAVGMVTFGDTHSASVDDIYFEGHLYGNLNHYTYKTEISQDDFLARYAPAILLDPAAYSTITMDDNVISFSNATRLEDWVARDGFELVDASGTAILNDQNLLTGFTYEIVYFYGSVRNEIIYTTEISDSGGSLDKPSIYTLWDEVPSADTPMMLERAYGYFLLSDAKSVISTQVVQCGAGNFTASQQNALLMHRGDDLKIMDQSAIEILNLSNGDMLTVTTGGIYEDGIFTYSDNGEEPQQMDLTAQEMEDIYIQSVDAYYPLLMNIDTMYASYVQGGTVFDYTLSHSISEGLRQEAQYFLFGEPQYLDLQSSGYELLLSEGYLAIDTYSGLPTANSVTYSALHTIDGEKHPLTMQVTQMIDAADRSVYSAITGESPAIVDVPDAPTPLFYHVSGENGEQMWLLGTIHLGDARTGNLPKEIQDAFADSDSLAVEFDLNDFAEQMVNDPELAETVLKEYLYLDGTMIEDHLQIPDLYAAAVQTMKMTGQLQGMILYTKPVIWSQIIEEFYLRLGYELSSEDGVDMQLLKMAQEQGKPILNVESGADQLKMLTGFSDEIQEMILVSTLSIDPASYNAETIELYELWCEGDEEKITAAMTTDTSSMTTEDLALYEEYTMAMETERNVQMLQVAEGYLESGETVFFAVGLAHLLAEDGLVHTLRDAGYTVELVAYS